MRANTAWFRDAKWGVFTHYLSPDELTPDQWNRRVDSFDVQGLADTYESVGARYCFITLGQNSGHYCSPNATYDSIVGIKPSKGSQRDLVSDLYDALSPKGIQLMVYLPSGAPDRDKTAMAALEWKNGQYPLWSHPKGGPDDPLVNFQRKWEAVIAEWSKRWGKKIRGWWFDGCYFPYAMYKRPEEPNFKSFAAAAKVGNPDSLVAFNPGVYAPVIPFTEYEDYTAGEVAEALPECKGRWLEGEQYHVLSYLGPTWGSGSPRFPDELVVGYTKHVTSKEGVVSWDVPITPEGRIPQPFIDQLSLLKSI